MTSLLFWHMRASGSSMPGFSACAAARLASAATFDAAAAPVACRSMGGSASTSSSASLSIMSGVAVRASARSACACKDGGALASRHCRTITSRTREEIATPSLMASADSDTQRSMSGLPRSISPPSLQSAVAHALNMSSSSGTGTPVVVPPPSAPLPVLPGALHRQRATSTQAAKCDSVWISLTMHVAPSLLRAQFERMTAAAAACLADVRPSGSSASAWHASGQNEGSPSSRELRSSPRISSGAPAMFARASSTCLGRGQCSGSPSTSHRGSLRGIDG
mmetsp:Transcript_305/g.1231  ORF Transcript_305/g.1231 Transcript_305/m.1231 type:complete len:279 (-) Transcript_305:927-1763(-)